jgi:hypothetical protein
MEVVNWFIAHWDEIIEIYLGLVGVASIIVKLTPTLKDDTVLKTIIRFIGKYIALNRK